MALQAFFQFHPVGQGCFYTGSFRYQNQEFNFAYDCGSVSKAVYRVYSIRQWPTTLQQRKLDLFIISHFDKDHVNGIEQLLHEVGECDTVIIPYLHPAERLLLIAAHTDDGNGGPDDDANYRNFLIDPISYLRNLKVGRIIMIDAPEDGDEGEEETQPPVGPGDGAGKYEDPKFWIEKRLKHSTMLSGKISKEYWPDSTPEGIRVECYSHKGALYIGMLWRFRFFVLKQSAEKIKSFKKMVEEIASGPIETVTNLTKLCNPDTIQQIRKAYAGIFTDVNSTSLVVVHEPITKRESVINYPNIYRLEFINYSLTPAAVNNNIPLFSNHRCATWLNGDISLQGGNYFDIKKHFKDSFDKISVCQVPHHGARDSWNSLITEDRNLNPSIFVINYGLDSSRYQHPHKEVLIDLLQKHKGLNHEHAAVQYSFYFDFRAAR